MLWRPKLLYCLEYGARSLLMPYLVVFLKDSGLTGGEIGVILLCRQICSIVGSPFWGAVADSTGQQKAVLLGCQLTAACVRVLIYYGWSFWSYLSLVILAECIGAPVTAMMDASTLHLLGDRSQDYGKQRLWGAVGWGTLALVGGLIYTNATINLMFPLYGIMASLATLATMFFPIYVSPPSVGVASKVKNLLGDGDVLLFLAVVWCMGTLAGVIGNFLFLHLKGLGASEYIMGLSLTFTCIAEIPVFFYSGPIIHRFGVPAVMIAALICYAIRVVWYSLLVDPNWVLPVELLHGVTYGAGWAACTYYAHQIAPPGLASTTQGVLAGVHWGLGNGGGAVIGGVLFERFGGATTFQASLIVAALGIFLALILRARQRRLAELGILRASSDEDEAGSDTEEGIVGHSAGATGGFTEAGDDDLMREVDAVLSEAKPRSSTRYSDQDPADATSKDSGDGVFVQLELPTLRNTAALPAQSPADPPRVSVVSDVSRRIRMPLPNQSDHERSAGNATSGNSSKQQSNKQHPASSVSPDRRSKRTLKRSSTAPSSGDQSMEAQAEAQANSSRELAGEASESIEAIDNDDHDGVQLRALLSQRSGSCTSSAEPPGSPVAASWDATSAFHLAPHTSRSNSSAAEY